MRRFRTRFLLLAAVLALAPTARAQAPSTPQPEITTPTLHGQLRLSVGEAVAMGIENNLNLQVERFDPLIQRQNEEAAWGAYDPRGTGSLGFSSSLQPTNNIFQGSSSGGLFGNQRIDRASNRATAGSLGVDALMPWLGATVSAEFSGDRTRTNSPVANYDPEYNSRLAFKTSIPLLKGLIWNEPWTNVKVNGILTESTRQKFRGELMNTVQVIEKGYWELVAAKAAVVVAEKSVETAKKLVDQTRTEYEVGVKSKVEVTEAEAGLADREYRLIVANNLFLRRQDELIDSVLGTRLTPGSKLEIEPTDNPENYIPYEIDVVAATERAFEYRPELLQAEQEIERREIRLKFAKNQRLPEFNLEGSFATTGKRGRSRNAMDDSGPLQPPDPAMQLQDQPSNAGSVGDTITDWFTPAGGSEFTVRGVVTIPIGNTAGRHNVSSATLELRKARTQYLQQRQAIILEVRNGARNLGSAQEGIEAAERGRVAAEEQLKAEQIRLEYGESTPFDVLQREEDLANARNQYIGALRTYRTSIVDLHRAQGTILKSRNIVVEEAATLR